MNQKSSFYNPVSAKAILNQFDDHAKAVASFHKDYEDEADGLTRVHFFINGRQAVIEHLGDTDPPRFIQLCQVVDLKREWHALSSAILLGIGFEFEVRDDQGILVKLLLKRHPLDRHVGDAFAHKLLDTIVSTVRHEFEDELTTGALRKFQDRISAEFGDIGNRVKALEAKSE